MRLLLLLAIACTAACHRGSKPHATGRLVFDTKPANEAGVFLATEAEVLRSSRVLKGIEEQWKAPAIDPSMISVTRHADTMILDITVTDRDAIAATETCNRVVQTYLDQRMEMALIASQERMEVLSQKLEASPDDAEIKRQLQELDTEQHLRKMDVHVLEPCTTP